MPNRAPTGAEINRETLYLDAYGMGVCDLLRDTEVNLGTPINKQAFFNNLIDLMAGDGWLLSGSGFFSAVFVKNGLALKVGFKVTDTAATYAAWCRANQDLPGVPTVYSLTKFSRCFLVLTRRYNPLTPAWLQEDQPDYLPRMSDEYQALQSAINCGKYWGLIRFDTVKTAKLIRDFFSGLASFDLHGQNLMIDDQGNIVITDPVCYGPCSDIGESYSSYSPAYTY